MGIKHEVFTKKYWRAWLAEFVGTYLFVFVETGAIMSTGNNILAVTLAVAFTILALNYTLQELSGAYFNPMITLAAVLVREISVWRGVMYVLAEMVGAAVAVVTIYSLIPHELAQSVAFEDVCTNLHGITRAQGVFMEMFITFALVFVVLMVDITPYRKQAKPFAPLIIASILIGAFFFAYPYTGASLNPARSFGPALVINCWNNHWIYWIGPLLGSLLAVLFFKVFETHWHETVDYEGSKEEEEVEVVVPPPMAD